MLLAYARHVVEMEEYTMERSALYDKIYACWLGKNIGGTLGTPVEGRMEVKDLTR